MYGRHLSSIYDLVYQARGKDFASEAADVTALIRARLPQADSLLDVACGTGAHLRHFTTTFHDVAGLEISEDMMLIAKENAPEVTVHLGDMTAFGLGRHFDAVTCMFSSIGHADDPRELSKAIACMADHLAPGGVLVIEPWWFPENFQPGYVGADLVRDGDRAVVRVSHSVLEGRQTKMSLHYVQADPDGIEHVDESMHITLFTRDEYESALRAAGCTVEYLPGGPSGRGLFVAVRQPG